MKNKLTIKNQDEMEVRNVARYYNTSGWETHDGITNDALASEDLRECAKEYIRKCRLRVLRHIPENGDKILDMASGPIQYKEYLAYSKNFNKRYCVDLSKKALDGAREKIGGHGVYIQGDFLNLEFDQNCFDCSISLHTIYHIHKDRQEDVVRKLLYVTKPGRPVVIVYSNPNAIISNLLLPIGSIRDLARIIFQKKNNDAIYFHPHPIGWWKKFADEADVGLFPWRSLSTRQQRYLIPDNPFGVKMLNALFEIEDRHPAFFTRHFLYPMIVLKKKK